jgi:20S proteasome alpha/beta subunit
MHKYLTRKVTPVTVCIAAIYNNNSILGASDRMISAGDITFEPPVSKIMPLTNSIAVMTAGDQGFQMQLFRMVEKRVSDYLDHTPEKWLDVASVADYYKKSYYAIRDAAIEDKILSRFGLNYASFLSTQQSMHPQFLQMLKDSIESFDDTSIGKVEVVIMGVDDSGAHIYEFDNGHINCKDKVGFAAIGIGAAHALSHFMLSGHYINNSEAKTLLTLHQAKKKSEVSPGVGRDTDMCLIGPRKGTFIMLDASVFDRSIISDLDQYYERYKESIKDLDLSFETTIKEYLNELTRKNQNKQEVTPSPTSSVSSSASPKTPTKKSKKARTSK